MYTEKGDVIIEREDQCSTCLNRRDCPLIEGLHIGIIKMDTPFLVTGCSWYTRIHMEIVK